MPWIRLIANLTLQKKKIDGLEEITLENSQNKTEENITFKKVEK